MPQFKASVANKEHLRIHAQKCEIRLRDEQRSVKNQKRLVRVQELMTSEEKEKKHKQQKKTEQRQAKLRAQNSLQLQNGPPAVTPVMVKSDSVSSISSSTKKQQQQILTPPPTTSRTDFSFVTASSSSQKQTVVDQLAHLDISSPSSQRSDLLESICNFKRGGLRKINSN